MNPVVMFYEYAICYYIPVMCLYPATLVWSVSSRHALQTLVYSSSEVLRCGEEGRAPGNHAAHAERLPRNHLTCSPGEGSQNRSDGCNQHSGHVGQQSFLRWLSYLLLVFVRETQLYPDLIGKKSINVFQM